MEIKKVSKSVEEIFLEFGFVSKEKLPTDKFFYTIAKPLAEKLYCEIAKSYCDTSGASVAGDIISVLVENDFVVQAACALKFLYDKASGMPENIKQLCEDEVHAKMFLGAMANSLIEVAELHC